MTSERSSHRVALRLPGPGETVHGYEIEATLAKGGFGVVYRAIAPEGGAVAMKVLDPTASEKFPGLAKRFLREIDLTSALDHPNIVRCLDHGETDEGLLWMAMELVGGEDLGSVLGRRRQLPPEEAKAIILQVLRGLAAAHSRGIVHRDLKPDNIMLTGPKGRCIKILDFGIGKALGADESQAIHNVTSTHGDAFGTPAYMAPELLLREHIGPSCDVYAAGLILYECLTGRAAVDGDSIYEILARQMSGTISMPFGLSGTPLAQVLERALRKNWRKRYRNATQFADALATLESLPTRISPPQPGPHDTQAPALESLGSSTRDVPEFGRAASRTSEVDLGQAAEHAAQIVEADSLAPDPSFGLGEVRFDISSDLAAIADEELADSDLLDLPAELGGQELRLGTGAPSRPAEPHEPSILHRSAGASGVARAGLDTRAGLDRGEADGDHGGSGPDASAPASARRSETRRDFDEPLPMVPMSQDNAITSEAPNHTLTIALVAAALVLIAIIVSLVVG